MRCVSPCPSMQEILQLSIPEEYQNTVGSKETAFFSFNGVLRDDATQEVIGGVQSGRMKQPFLQTPGA